MLRNDGGTPMRCLLMLAHWVTRDLPVLQAGAETTVTMRRQPEDGALYLPRADGRRMMVETLVCGEDARWGETRGDVPLQPLRQGAARLFAACRIGPRLRCTVAGGH